MLQSVDQLHAVEPSDPRLHAIKVNVTASGAPVLDTSKPEHFISQLSQGGEPIIFLCQGSAVAGVGYIALVKLDNSDEMEIRSLMIRSEYRRQGYGNVMVTYAEEVAREHGRVGIKVVTHPSNEAALALYQNRGFTVKEVIDDYYGDGEPRCVLRKQLAQPHRLENQVCRFCPPRKSHEM